MSDLMAVTVKIEEGNMDGEDAAAVSSAGGSGSSLEPASLPTPVEPEVGASEIKEEPIDLLEHPVKRRASDAFSDDEKHEMFHGFDYNRLDWSTDEYGKALERMEAEVSAVSGSFTPVRNVVATPTTAIRVSKRLRQDTGTDTSRPSSAMSSRSEGDGILTDASTASSPAFRTGRRATTTEITSPLLRVPLDRGWRRELVYRAALDAHSRRNADIYYYMPNGKKLRSTREIAEQLSGTGLTLENFSFAKEPLGVDDPEKEIIRDAKLMRRVDSPVTAPSPAPVEGKRTPKPKPPKGASPEPATPVSPPAKIKVKLTGSRLSTGSTGSASAPAKQAAKKPAPAAAPATANAAAPAGADNNNTTNWKKPSVAVAGADRVIPPPDGSTVALHGSAVPPQGSAVAPHGSTVPPHGSTVPPHGSAVPPHGSTVPPHGSAVPPHGSAGPPDGPTDGSTAPPQGGAVLPQGAAPPHGATGAERAVPPPPPLRSRPPETPPQTPAPQRYNSPAGPSPAPPDALLAAQSPPQVQQPCSIACGGGAVPSLACASCLCLYHPACANYRPPAPFFCKNCKKSSSPPLQPPPLVHKSGAPAPRAPVAPPRRPVLLTMKVSGSDAGGQRVWSVSRPAGVARALAMRPQLPQSLALINGRRFIVVPRSVNPPPHDAKPKSRLSNGSAIPAAGSPRRRGRARADDTDYFTDFCNKSKEENYSCVIQIFQYLGMRDLAHCARVCRLWRDLVDTPALWRHVRMKNSHVSDWSGLCSALKKHGTTRLDLRKMLLPQNDTAFWEAFAKHLPDVDTLERIEMCRCPASAVEAVCRGNPSLRSLSALAVRDARLDPSPLARLHQLQELRLKSMAGLALARDLQPLAALHRLQHLSLTSIKELGCCACEIVGQLKQLVSLELGECTFRASFGAVLATLPRLQRLRLERGTAECAAPALLRALATLPRLHQLELVNFDVKVGFDDALAECKNIQRLLIIPTYVSQSATTNKQVLSGVLRLKDTLTHLMWGVTIELLRVTELFIDQCDQGGDSKKKDIGECIPVLKPVPGCRLPEEHHHVAGPPQVEILPLPTLQRLLSAQLPTTKLKLLRIPFHATWRQSLADFQ